MEKAIHDNFTRQLDIINPSRIPTIDVIGAGAIGSGICIMLAKLGTPHVIVWDGDNVEQHNIPNQYFPYSELGKNKAEAMVRVMSEYSPSDILPFFESKDKYFNDEDSPRGKIVFMCADGFDNRIKIFRRLQQCNVNWVIDCRMGAEYYQVYVVDMNDNEAIEAYRESLTGTPQLLPCTGRSVIYNVLSVASLAVSILKKILVGQDHPVMMAVDLMTYCPNWVRWNWRR